MAISLSPEWGPYQSPLEAGLYLGRFIDKACGPGTGIVWAANGNLYPLRAPRRDCDGLGDVAIFEWNKPAPPAPQPSGFWGKVKSFIVSVLEAEGEAQLQQSEAQIAMGNAIAQVVGRALHSHQDDGVGVALDVVGIVLSLALLPTGLGVVGLVGLVGSAFLLGTDSWAYALEMNNREQAAEEFKKNTERYRLVATVMTLPDVAYGGYKAVREMIEIRAMATLDRTTAQAATAMSARTANATRAERFHQVAERANLRAQIRTEQIRASLKLEIAPKGTGVGSTILLVREEVQNDDSVFHQFLRSLQVHSATVHAR